MKSRDAVARPHPGKKDRAPGHIRTPDSFYDRHNNLSAICAHASASASAW